MSAEQAPKLDPLAGAIAATMQAIRILADVDASAVARIEALARVQVVLDGRAAELAALATMEGGAT